MQDVAPEQVEASLRAAIGELTEPQLAMIHDYGCRIYGNSQGNVRISIGNPRDRAGHEDAARWGLAYVGITAMDELGADDSPEPLPYLLFAMPDLAGSLSFMLNQKVSGSEDQEP
jgi:hypothetical protein